MKRWALVGLSLWSLVGVTSANELKPYTGTGMTPALALTDLEGKAQDLRDYRGQVVLVNFWASWCPPCVHEMPSMQRLGKRWRDKPFTIVAVNMGEDAKAVREFTQKVKVDFPIWLDRDGAALKRWKVFAFPTSFVVDRAGNIRFALYGALEWDAPETVAQIETLFADEPRKAAR